MNWCNFTIQNASKYTNYTINDNSLLLKNIKKDRDNIKNLMNNNINITIREIENFEEEIDEFANGSFVAREELYKVKHLLEDNYIVEWQNGFIKINTIKSQFLSFEKRVKVLIYIIEYLRIKSKNTNYVKIYLVLSKLEKTFPEDGVMEVENANTGYTDFMKNIIFIWRLEEFEKVILHEIIHYFELDDNMKDDKSRIKIQGEHRYYEGFTDFWGIYYYIIYLSLITKIKIKKLLELELCFIKNQAMQLNSLLKLNSWEHKPLKTIIQKTAGFSYYIIKYLLFEYSHNNKIINNLKILDTVLKKGLKQEKYNKIKSARMTLLQIY